MSILVVDDNDTGREMFELVLESAGYSDVFVVDSAAAAFNFLSLNSPSGSDARPVDLILLDVIMPDIDGFEACSRIRRDPRYRDVPITMTTSLNDMRDVNQAFECGATGYLTKPLNAVDLVACVRSTLEFKARIDKGEAQQRELLQYKPFF